MKQIFISLWAWVVAHPAETLGVLYVALNAINAAIPVETRKTSRLARVLDALCVVTQRGAQNATSWPVVGRSMARDAIKIAVDHCDCEPPVEGCQCAVCETIRDGRKAREKGFIHYGLAVAIAIAVILIGVALTPGCSSSQSVARAVQPIALHEVQHPEHGACHEVGAQAQSRALGRSLTIYAGVCLGRFDGGAAQDAAGVE